MTLGVADLKLQSRRALHERLAVSARLPAYPEATEITVRWHNKLARAGAQEGGFGVEIIEGIDRLVFSDEQLAAAGIELGHGTLVEVPSLGATFTIDADEPTDGPHNVYWSVIRK